MARVPSCILTQRSMWVVGNVITSMDMAKSTGQTVLYIKVTTKTGSSTAMGTLFGQTRAPTLVSSRITTYPEKASINGRMGASTRVRGKTTGCMAMGYLSGRMDVAMKGTT
jgi:hypothetical protein